MPFLQGSDGRRTECFKNSAIFVPDLNDDVIAGAHSTAIPDWFKPDSGE
jgi:hypothetical protein